MSVDLLPGPVNLLPLRVCESWWTSRYLLSRRGFHNIIQFSWPDFPTEMDYIGKGPRCAWSPTEIQWCWSEHCVNGKPLCLSSPSLCAPSYVSDLLIDGTERIMKLPGGSAVLIALPTGWLAISPFFSVESRCLHMSRNWPMLAVSGFEANVLLHTLSYLGRLLRFWTVFSDLMCSYVPIGSDVFHLWSTGIGNWDERWILVNAWTLVHKANSFVRRILVLWALWALTCSFCVCKAGWAKPVYSHQIRVFIGRHYRDCSQCVNRFPPFLAISGVLARNTVVYKCPMLVLCSSPYYLWAQFYHLFVLWRRKLLIPSLTWQGTLRRGVYRSC